MTSESKSVDENQHESLELIVDRFETSLLSEPNSSEEILRHIPSLKHPQRLEILCELIRIDLEFGNSSNHPKPLNWYESKFPELFEIQEYRELILFEVKRLKVLNQDTELFGSQAASRNPDQEFSTDFGTLSDSIIVEELHNTSGIKQASSATDPLIKAAQIYQSLRSNDPNGATVNLTGHLEHEVSYDPTVRTFCDTCAKDPALADKLASATLSMPEVGDRFLQFRLEKLLGRGTFGRVFLARQGDLANRLVALKITADVGGEARHLAQLQHTNIIPIYSVHRIGNLRAVCMPYLGSATLADLVSQIKGKDSIPQTWAEFVSSFFIRQHSALVQNSNAKASFNSDDQQTKTLSDSALNKNDSQSISFANKRKFQQQTVVEVNESIVTSSEIELYQTRSGSFSKAFVSSNLQNLEYVSAILWLMKRIADGLAHAHQRGIIHRDLKPANILFSDDGEPLLLDFNISADTKDSGFHQIGGTLPYMAPEHLKSLLTDEIVLSPICDIFSVGVIFYELLSGSLPFPSHFGSMRDILPIMIEDRQKRPALPVTKQNPQVTPAINAIVERCLHPDPGLRYQSAQELSEDIDRQLRNLPLRFAREVSLRERLKKWGRRNPVLTSSSFVITISLIILLIGLGAFLKHDQNYRIGQAQLQFRNVQEQWPRVISGLLGKSRIEQERTESLLLCKHTLSPYLRKMDPSNWPDQELITLLEPEQQRELLRNLSELMFLWSKSEFDEAVKQSNTDLRLASLNRAQKLLEMSRTGYVGREIPVPLNRLEKRIVEFRDQGIIEEPKSGTVLSSKTGSKETLPDSDQARENILELADLDEGVGNENLLATLAALSDQSSSNPYTWTLIGNAFASNGQIDKAIDDYGHAIALDQGLIWPRMHRGILYLEKFDYQSALRDFDQVVQRRPDLPAGWLNRALAKLGLGDPQGALDDLEQITDLKETPTRVGFIRAKCLEALGRYAEALKLREETTRITPNDELSWVARGSSRIQTDPKAALEDFKEALKLNPNSIVALQNKAFVELEYFRQLDQSIETLTELIQKNPRFVPALAGRGVLLARNGREKEAVKDAESALLFDNSPFTRYQVACIYALLSKKRQDYQASAIKLLSQALRADPKLVKTAVKDTDLENIQHLTNFRNLMDVIQKLNDPGIR